MPPRNKRQRGSSSSQPTEPTPTDPAFILLFGEGPIGQSRYDNWIGDFRSRRVLPGRAVNITARYFKYLHDFLDSLGWGNNIIFLPSHYYPDAVRYFYCNLSSETDSHRGPIIRTYVYGVPIELDRNSLSTILNIPLCDLQAYPTSVSQALIHADTTLDTYIKHVFDVPAGNSQPSAKSLKPFFRLFRLYMGHNILPKAGHFDEVSNLMTFILFCCANEIPLDLSFIILHQMIACQNAPIKGLPYGALLTRIFNHFEVPLPDRDATPLPQPIDDLTIGRSLPISDDIPDAEFDDLLAEHTASGSSSGPTDDSDTPAWARHMMEQQERRFSEFSLDISTRVGNLENQVGHLTARMPQGFYHPSSSAPYPPYSTPYPPVPSPQQFPPGTSSSQHSPSSSSQHYHPYYPSQPYYPPRG